MADHDLTESELDSLGSSDDVSVDLSGSPAGDVAPEGEKPEQGVEPTAETLETTSTAPAVGDDTKITLPDGTEVTLADLKKGHLLHRDYTTKTQRLADERRKLEASQSKWKAELQEYAHMKKLLENNPEQRAKLREAYLEALKTGEVPDLTQESAEESAQEPDPMQEEVIEMLVERHLSKIESENRKLEPSERHSVLSRAAELSDKFGNKTPLGDVLSTAYWQVMGPRMLAQTKEQVAKETAQQVSKGKAAKTIPGIASNSSAPAPKKPIVGDGKMSHREFLDDLGRSLGLRK